MHRARLDDVHVRVIHESAHSFEEIDESFEYACCGLFELTLEQDLRLKEFLASRIPNIVADDIIEH